ncbi:MAG: DMT family transporter [Myxococcaceae bacterium]|nr:DMT family transporter [Myxococcaceae bacterium]
MSTPSPAGAGLNRGYAIALVSALILSTTAILIRHLTVTYGLPPLVLAFWRNAFVVLTLLPVLGVLGPWRLRVARRDLPFLLAYGLVLAAFNTLWTLSVARIGASLATVLVYSSGASTALLGAWLLGERLGRARGLAVVTCLAGCVWVSGVLGAQGLRADLIGLAAGLLSGLTYAVYSLLGRSAAQRGLDPWGTVLYAFGFGALFLLLGILGPARFLPAVSARPAELLWLGDAVAGWGELLLLAAGPTVIGFGLYGVSLSYLPASVANLILTLEPAFTTVIAWALLGERLSAGEAAGGGLILVGVAILRIGHCDMGTLVANLSGARSREAWPWSPCSSRAGRGWKENPETGER